MEGRIVYSEGLLSVLVPPQAAAFPSVKDHLFD